MIYRTAFKYFFRSEKNLNIIGVLYDKVFRKIPEISDQKHHSSCCIF